MKKNSNKGFSLVELIVVIAIMAIIAAVAIPVYSSYIESANKGVDEALAAEVKHNIELALLATKPADFAGGVIIAISPEGAIVTGKDGTADADKDYIKGVLEATYGEKWNDTIKAKYSGWNVGEVASISGQFKESSFNGKQGELLEQVQVLSTMIQDYANNTNSIGSAFPAYLDELAEKAGVDKTNSTVIGNATVLYVAQTMREPELMDLRDTFVEEWAFSDYETLFASAPAGATAATLYAFTEALCQYCTKYDNGPLEEFHKPFTIEDGPFTAVEAKFATVSEIIEEKCPQVLEEYFAIQEGDDIESLPAVKDARAFFATLDAIDDSQNSVIKGIAEGDCYNSGELLDKLNAYLDIGSVEVPEGSIAIAINASTTQPSGFSVSAYPMDFKNK